MKEKLAEGKIFECPNTELYLKSLDKSAVKSKTVFKDLNDLKESFLDPLNEDNITCEKSYKIFWTRGDKYIKIGCQFRGCRFVVWFNFKEDQNGLPI